MDLLSSKKYQFYVKGVSSSSHRGSCHSILAHIYGQDFGTDQVIPHSLSIREHAETRTIECGDRMIDLASFHDRLWQVGFRPSANKKFSSTNPQLSNFGREVEFTDVKETIQQLLRWKYSKNLEEQAA
ncbi:hypothetical protein PanWU01x14_145680 [Parasponia andersonii]|uniref:Uncharacterized protein n=1 Tax=Parasponia andersonii TaxID=3476 RepID=A0A2P5CK68_PARAD|nr:hypothetical protein PanWU01x14_145680 [Parasponia andersonii]